MLNDAVQSRKFSIHYIILIQNIYVHNYMYVIVKEVIIIARKSLTDILKSDAPHYIQMCDTDCTRSRLKDKRGS